MTMREQLTHRRGMKNRISWPLKAFHLSIFFKCVYLFERVTERISKGNLPVHMQKAARVSAEPGQSQELHPGILHGWLGPKHLGHLPLLSTEC